MPKSQFSISRIDVDTARTLLSEFHYLHRRGKSNKSGLNFGLFLGGELVGVCIFTGCPVRELAKSMFGLPFEHQRGIVELSRLCLRPDVQRTEHNLASWFVARCIRQMRKELRPQALLSYADSDVHIGKVYKALGFTYCGLTADKKDFWVKQPDGSYKMLNRGKTKGVDGEWRPRSRKHRYVIVYDNALTLKWPIEPYPTDENEPLI